MHKKISKQLLSIFIIMFMLCENCLAYVIDYSEGPNTYEVNLTESVYGTNINTDENGYLIMKADSMAAYEFYLPFESTSAEIIYSVNTPVTIEYDFGEGMQSASVAAISSNVSVNFNQTKNAGDERVVIKTSGDVTIRKILFKKVKNPVCVPAEISKINPDTRPLPKLNTVEEAIQTAVIINPSSPVIMVNGAKRYVDYNDPSKCPEIINGSLYLPIKTFAEALGYYYEENVSKKWALLRNGAFEFVYKNNELYRQTNGVGYEKMTEVIEEKYGTYYIPVRYFSEIIGKRVIYKDGYTFIENSEILIRNIVNTSIFDEIKKMFNEYSIKQQGTTYYVAQTDNASDDNNGSENSPFKTLKKAGEVANSGDTVIIGEGIYRETLSPKNSGTASSPIIFKAAEGADVCISALEEITAVPELEDDLYVYDMGYSMGDGRNIIFKSGDVVVEARHPNENTSPRGWPSDIGLSPLWATLGNIQVACDGKADTATSATDLNQSTDYWKGGTLVSLHGEAWSLGTAKITGSDDGILYLGDSTESWWYKIYPHPTDFAYITDCKNAIDLPGEWYWDDETGKLYIKMFEGETPETVKLEAKKRQVTVDFAENSYVQLVNVNTKGGGMKLNHSEMCVINGGKHEYVAHYTFSKDQHYAFIDNHNVTDKNGAPLRGEMGITLGGRDNAVINTNIKYSAASGIYANGLYSYIANNFIDECGYMASYVGGIFVIANAAEENVDTPRGGQTILYNTVRRSGRGVFQIAAIEAPWFYSDGQAPMLAMDIGYNKFSEGSIFARDTGTVYIHGAVLGSDRAKTKFHNNVVCNPLAYDGGMAGLYWDNWVHGADCYDNIVYTSNGLTMNMGSLYVQDVHHFVDSYATIGTWNNMLLGHTDKDIEEMDETMFPNSRKFAVGYMEDRSQYSANMDLIDVEATAYPATNAEKKGNITMNNGFAEFSDNGETLCFKNVDFSDKYNSIAIIFKGDKSNTGDSFDIMVGESEADAEMVSSFLFAVSPNENDVSIQSIAIPGCSGVKNVYVRPKAYKSAKIGGIKPINVDEKAFDEIIYGQTYMSKFDTLLAGGALVKDGPTGEKGKEILYNTQGKATVEYKNVNISKDVNTFILSGASGAPYNRQTVQLRVGDPNSEVIAEFKTTSDDWSDYVSDAARMNTVLKKGTYDIYITFVEGALSTNAWWFGFRNSTEEVAE